MCKIAEKYVGKKVFNIRIENINYVEEYDAIWACASLLHIRRDEQNKVIKKVLRSIKAGGILYASWKYGNTDMIVDGRYYNHMNENMVTELFTEFVIKIKQMWISEDLQNRADKWLNVIVQKG